MNQPQRIQTSEEFEFVTRPFVCPECQGTAFRKNGKNYTGSQIYECKQCLKQLTPFTNIKKPNIVVDPQAEYLKDCWDSRALGMKGVGDSSYKINFTPITQDWLRETAKKHCKVLLSSRTLSTVQERAYSLRKFSRFLNDNYHGIEPQDIDRSVITDFTLHLASQGLAPATRQNTMSSLRLFLDDTYMNKWLDVRRYLVRSEDFPAIPETAPRYIPEEVIDQLFIHLDKLAPPVQRMVHVILEVGMRISELVNLNFDCLLQDKAGDWFLKYYAFKMKKELTVPINRELVLIIQTQQRYIRKHFSKQEFDCLFCANLGAARPHFKPSPRIMARKTFPNYLNRLAKAYNICDSTGEIWHFQTHQFRHTVGTRMINNDVAQHYVQRYLGHESPLMTARYAHIHDQTMKQEIAKFHGKVVNVSGKVIEQTTPEVETGDLQWFKRHVQAQALPNGSCALPVISQGCPHANACLTCTHFRTTSEYLPEHFSQLEQTNRIIAKAEANGWQRQVEMNLAIKTNLESIIGELGND